MLFMLINFLVKKKKKRNSPDNLIYYTTVLHAQFQATTLTKHVLTLPYLSHSLDHLYQTMTLFLYSIRIKMLLTLPLNCIQQSTFEITKLNQHESFLLQLIAMILSSWEVPYPCP